MPAIGFATSVAGVLLLRSAAWACRGFRGPIRDTLLVEGTDPRFVNRAFGFQRSLDTVGAVLGPVTAIALVAEHVPVHDAILFGFLPGLLAGVMYLWVRERPRRTPPRAPLRIALGELPASFKRYLLAAGVFGLGNFSATLLVLVAMEAFTPRFGAGRATAFATALYLGHNVLYAACTYPASVLSERFGSGRMLIAAFALFSAAGLVVAVGGPLPAAVIAAFALAALGIAILDPMEATFATHLLTPGRRGTGFGALAAVNGIGDFVSSLGVGALWQLTGEKIAFGASALVCTCGLVLLLPVALKMKSE